MYAPVFRFVTGGGKRDFARRRCEGDATVFRFITDTLTTRSSRAYYYRNAYTFSGFNGRNNSSTTTTTRDLLAAAYIYTL